MSVVTRNDPKWSFRSCPTLWWASALVWGFAEGFFFFLIPDILISAGALLSPQKALRLVLLSITGACLAGLCLFSWASHSPEKSLQFVQAVPFVKPWMTERTLENWRENGIQALYQAPSQGIPYKLNAVIATEYVSQAPFLLHTIPVRGIRFLIAWSIAATIGLAFRRWSRSWHDFLPLMGLLLCFWTINYAIYWSVI